MAAVSLFWNINMAAMMSFQNDFPPLNSDNKDNKSGLICRRRLFLKKAQMVTGERRAKGRALLEALEGPGIS